MAPLHIEDGLLGRVNRLSELTGESIEAILEQSLQLYEHQRLTPQSKIFHDEAYFFRLIADNVLDLVMLHEADGRILYASPSMTRIGGYSLDDIIGQDPYSFFHPDDIPAIEQSHAQSLDGERVNSVIYRHRCKDGRYIWLDTLTTPVLDEDGKVINLVTVSRDVTERVETERALQEERDLFKTLMETSPSGIIVVSKDGQIVFSNRRAEEITGMTDGEKSTDRTYDAPEWKHTDYDGNAWHDEQQPFVRVMNTRETVWDVRHAIEWSNGRRVYLSINGAPILDEHGEVDKVIFTMEDYTERKHQQDAIQEALKREKHLSRLKSNFISMVSHEFRTPLSVILTSTDILRRKLHDLSPEQVTSRLDKIVHQVRRLSDLLGEVTFINKDQLMGHEAQSEAVNLTHLIEQIVDEVQSAFPAHCPIDAKIDLPEAPIVIDESLVQKIITNLLTNAMKYSPPKAQVRLVCTGDDDAVTLTVSDKGIGIPLADQADLFNEFHRAGNVGTISGTGLGLAIVKRAVDALGGTVTFESAENVGTTFTITLPISVVATP